MVSTQYCLNCGTHWEQDPPDDAFKIFFCDRCYEGLSQIQKNNVAMGWIKARAEAGEPVATGQRDNNWPEGFPFNQPLR